jgi:hypothetical protein
MINWGFKSLFFFFGELIYLMRDVLSTFVFHVAVVLLQNLFDVVVGKILLVVTVQHYFFKGVFMDILFNIPTHF